MKILIFSLLAIIVSLVAFIVLTGRAYEPMGCQWWGRLFILFMGMLLGAIAGHSLTNKNQNNDHQ